MQDFAMPLIRFSVSGLTFPARTERFDGRNRIERSAPGRRRDIN
jgi:hypothetical protein